jgi:hypothetical protein
MSIFSSAINGFRSTASRAGKFYNSPGAQRAKAVARGVANDYKTNRGLVNATALVAGGGAVVGGVSDRDNHLRGAIGGAAMGAAGMAGMRGYRRWGAQKALSSGAVRMLR